MALVSLDWGQRVRPTVLEYVRAWGGAWDNVFVGILKLLIEKRMGGRAATPSAVFLAQLTIVCGVMVLIHVASYICWGATKTGCSIFLHNYVIIRYLYIYLVCPQLTTAFSTR